MTQEDEYLSRLLPIDELFLLYSKIGDSINTQIDLLNANFDYLAKNNSMLFLDAIGMVAKKEEFYEKAVACEDTSSFIKTITGRIHSAYEQYITLIESKTTHYDDQNGYFYGYRNDLPLSYAGLIMLLGDIGFINLTETRYYLTKNDSRQNRKDYNDHSSAKHITLIELEDNLLFKKRIGEEAELAALEYEKKVLEEKGIDKQPKQISHIDASAGYDIVSYKSSDSKVPDKFIEVKSCNDKEGFFMSRNEVETSLKKGDSYYLYLFNRKDKTIHVIQNPYKSVIENENWIKESQILRIRKI